MSKLNLTKDPIVNVTHLFGCDTRLLSDDSLLQAAKYLKAEKEALTKAAEGLNSSKMQSDIEKLEKGLQAIVKVLDKENRIILDEAKTHQVKLDFSLEPLQSKNIVFGVYSEDLTEANLKEAMTELNNIIEHNTKINKDFNSERISKLIERDTKNLKELVKIYDQLEIK